MLETVPVSVTAPTDFESTFNAHFEPMVRALTLAAGSRAVAEDCVQEAYARAFARWRRISGYDDPAGWIRHVALNVMRDHHRRSGRQRRAVERLAGQAETVQAPIEPDGALADAVAALPPQQRTAVGLFYVEQLSVRETATAMGLSEGAVKYHLHAARAALRAAWEQQS